MVPHPVYFMDQCQGHPITNKKAAPKGGMLLLQDIYESPLLVRRIKDDALYSDNTALKPFTGSPKDPDFFAYGIGGAVGFPETCRKNA